ncbi:hypothetical protein [Shewanella algae]
MKRVKVVLVSLLFSGAGMAYDLHIEDSGKTIEQWAAFVESSPFLSASPSAEARNPATGEVISINTPNAAKAENSLYFSPRNSSSGLVITISNPSESEIPFLKSITKEFGGVLVGDEGEEY